MGNLPNGTIDAPILILRQYFGVTTLYPAEELDASLGLQRKWP